MNIFEYCLVLFKQKDALIGSLIDAYFLIQMDTWRYTLAKNITIIIIIAIMIKLGLDPVSSHSRAL